MVIADLLPAFKAAVFVTTLVGDVPFAGYSHRQLLGNRDKNE